MPGKLTVQQLTEYAYSTAYLRPTQIYNRVRHVLRKKLLHQRPQFQSWFLRQSQGDEAVRLLQFPDKNFQGRTNPSELATGTFTFLNRSVDLGQPVDWLPTGETKLWQYNLHYFDFGLDLAKSYFEHKAQSDYDLFRQLVSDWIEHCPVAQAISWDAYPASLRVVNWIKAYTLLHDALTTDESFAKQLRRSIYIQTCFLEKHLEYHLLNNHLLENGKTLFIAGHFFPENIGDRWRKKGAHILTEGLKNNFLSDGGHEERSPMYHQIMLDLFEDVQAVCEQTEDNSFPDLPNKIDQMRQWLSHTLHPDGKISLLNDAAFGIAPEPASDGIEPSDDGFSVLEESGYFIFRNSNRKHFMIFDAGPLGPDHQTAHGHCDTFSYELSIDGERMVVDAGVSDYYGDIDWRNYYRSTRAHNTVVVDGQEQSEIWDRFRVARRAHVKDTHWSDDNEVGLSYVTASHDGFQRFKPKVTHRRYMGCIEQELFIVADHVTGQGQHTTESLIHFHPDAKTTVPPAPTRFGEITVGNSILRVIPFGVESISTCQGETSPIQGWYSPEFGLKQESQVWKLRYRDALPSFAGYLLWPESTLITCELEVVSATKSQLRICTPDQNYQVIFEQDNMQMEKIR